MAKKWEEPLKWSLSLSLRVVSHILCRTWRKEAMAERAASDRDCDRSVIHQTSLSSSPPSRSSLFLSRLPLSRLIYRLAA